MLKKMIVLLAAVLLFTGCTTIESTQKFNAVNLGNNEEKAVCQTFVEITGIYFFGLPIIVGSAKGDGQFTFFRFNVTNENVVFLLTRTVKAHGANRMTNVHVSSHSNLLLLPFLSFRNMQGSATGLRSKRAALKQVHQEFNSF
ncbi:MAG: hypothetical protein IKC65_04650 [Lentisphaeria bacterium]|nr:hypothetical protein [Lentisphaeria bacterium]